MSADNQNRRKNALADVTDPRVEFGGIRRMLDCFVCVDLFCLYFYSGAGILKVVGFNFDLRRLPISTNVCDYTKLV